MKKSKLILLEIFIGILLLAFTSCAPSQYFSSNEYDDMYYTSNDRQSVPVLVASTSNTQYNYRQDENKTENWSAKNVNPEYTSRYVQEQYEDTLTIQEEKQVDREYIINNYYSTPFYPNYSSWDMGFSYMGRMYDPFYNPYWLETQYFYPNHFMHYSPSAIYMTLRLNRFPRAYAQYYAYNYHRFWNPYSYYGGHYGYGGHYSGHYGYSRHYGYNSYYSGHRQHYGYNNNETLSKKPKYQARTQQRNTSARRIVTPRNTNISNTPRNNRVINKQIPNRSRYSKSQNELNNRTNTSVTRIQTRTKSSINYQKPQKSSTFRGSNTNYSRSNAKSNNSSSRNYSTPSRNNSSRSNSTPSYSSGSRSSSSVSGSRSSGSSSRSSSSSSSSRSSGSSSRGGRQ